MKVTVKDGNKGKVHIYIDGEYSLTVDMKYWQTLGIAENEELNEEEIDRLKASIRLRRAFNKGAELLENREHSRMEIIRKLNERGFGDCSGEAAELLIDSGFLNEERYCEVCIRHLLEDKHFGKRRILSELISKGIDRSTAEEAAEKFTFDESEEIRSLLEGKLKRYMVDEAGKKKCFHTLIRYGYSPSDIRRAMAALEENDYE